MYYILCYFILFIEKVLQVCVLRSNTSSSNSVKETWQMIKIQCKEIYIFSASPNKCMHISVTVHRHFALDPGVSFAVQNKLQIKEPAKTRRFHLLALN